MCVCVCVCVCVHMCRQVAECPLDLVEVLSPLVLKQMKTCPASSSPSSDWSLALLNPAGAALEGELWKWLLQKFGQSDKEVQSCDRQVCDWVVMRIALGDVT